MTAALNADKLRTFNEALGEDQVLFVAISDTNVNDRKNANGARQRSCLSLSRTFLIGFVVEEQSCHALHKR